MVSLRLQRSKLLWWNPPRAYWRRAADVNAPPRICATTSRAVCRTVTGGKSRPCTRKLGTVDGLSEVALEFRQAAGKGSSPNQFVHCGRVAEIQVRRRSHEAVLNQRWTS